MKQAAVEIFTFRPFAVRVNGAPLEFAAKTQRKPLALLKALIALGGTGVPESLLTDSLWPDADGDAAHRSFATTLHRLRKLVGQDTLKLRDRRLSLVPDRCWVDCDALDALFAEVDSAGNGEADPSSESLVDRLSRVLELYRAPFLKGEYDPPEILAARERWHGRFLRQVEAGVDRLMRGGWAKEAEDALRRAIEIDGSSEDLHRRLIQCLIERGRRAEGLAAYQSCQRLLQEALGVEPSPETAALLEASVKPSGAGTRPPPPGPHPGPSSAPRAGERRRLTVLELDWSAGPRPDDPEAEDERAQHISQNMGRIVRSQGGSILGLQGTRATALFGWPAAHEDDSVRAVRAALALAAESRDVRQGIASGPVVMHPDEAVGGMRVTGRPLDAARQLALRAAPGQTLLDTATLPRVSGYFSLRVLRAGRGREPAFRVLGPTAARSAFEAAVQRGLTPFTGREKELERLEQALALAMSGQGRFVTINGEAGIGKSRLVHEFRRSIDRNRVSVLEGRCQSYGGGTPYLPLLDALRRGLGLADGATAEPLEQMAVDALLALDPSLERHVPLLLHLLSIPSQTRPLPAILQGDALRLAFEEALAAVAIASASKQPLVLIYEDWHWADEASESALRRLLPLVPQHPLLIAVLHRPDYAPRWGNPADHQAIALTALPPADTAAMLSSRLGAREVAPDLVALVHERTGGNPFFVEELVQSLLAEQGVAIREGRAGLAGTLDSSVIPASVEAVVRSRMDRLDPAAREVLRWASVIGRDFPRQILERVSCAGASLPAVLDRLAAEELIQPVRLLPEPEHRFKHVLAQVAVYESLLTGERKSRHAQVGAAIEQAYAGRLEEHYESLAHHYSNSDNLGKAIEYLEKAGDKAAKLVFKLQAENLLTSAIHLLGSLPSSDRTKRERVRITLKLCRASETSTSAARAGILEKAVSCCSEINDPHLLAELYFEFAQYYFFLGNLPKMREFLVLCRALSVEHRIGKLDTTTSGQLALQCYWQGQYELGIQYLAPYRNDLRRMDPIWLMFFLGNLHAAQGNFEEAYSILRDMSREVSEDPFLCAWSDWWFAYTSTVQGSWQFGIKHVERALVSMQQVEDQFGVVDAQWLRAYLFAMCGNLGPNLRSMKQAIDTKLSARNVTLGMTGILGLYAELCCLAGDWVSADHSAWRATEIAQATGEQHGMGIAQRASAMAATGKLQPDWNMVRARFDGCLKDFRTQGARPFLAVTQFRYAECLHKLGDLDAALAQLAQAETAFAELDMPWWLDQAEALRGRIERRDPFRGFAPYVNGPDAPVPE